MYVVDIWNSKTQTSAGLCWIIKPLEETMEEANIWNSKTQTIAGLCWITNTLEEAMEKAREWVAKTSNPEDYHVMYHIVGCL